MHTTKVTNSFHSKKEFKVMQYQTFIITFAVAAGRFVATAFIAGEESPGNRERHTS